MALEIWWGSGSPYSWRALLALEYKQLSYQSHLVQFAKQEHKAPALLKMNPRGRVPVLKDGDYVCFESLAILHYLDRKYPQPPVFGRTGEEGGTKSFRFSYSDPSVASSNQLGTGHGKSVPMPTCCQPTRSTT